MYTAGNRELILSKPVNIDQDRVRYTTLMKFGTPAYPFSCNRIIRIRRIAGTSHVNRPRRVRWYGSFDETRQHRNPDRRRDGIVVMVVIPRGPTEQTCLVHDMKVEEQIDSMQFRT